MANEKLSYEIAALYTGQPAIKSAFDDFAKLNAAGAKVTRELDSLAKQSQKTGEALRNSRQGTAQLGMQFNQLGTQIASGTSAATAFAQQIGDVGYALSFMDGRLGAVGRFLAGPWGAAIGLAAVALGPLIDNLFAVSEETKNNEDAAKDLDSAIASRVTSEENLRLALAKTATEYANIRKEMQANALQAMRTAEAELNARFTVLQGLLADSKRMDAELKKSGGLRAQAEFGTGQIIDRYLNTKDIEQSITAVNAQLTVLEEATAKLNASTVDVASAQNRVNKELQKGSSSRKEANKESDKQARIIEKETSAYERLEEKLRSIITLQVSESDAIGKAKNDLAEFDKLIKSLTESTVNGKPVGANLVKELGYEIDTVRGKLEAATVQTEFFMGKIPETTPAVVEAVRAQLDAFDALGNSVDDAFKQMLTAGGSWRDGMKSIIQSVIDQLWKMYVTQQIVGMITGALSGLVGISMPTTSQIMANSNSILAGMTPMAPGFANGTNNAPGGMAWVGERGPELVNLPRGSQVIPAHRASQMSGGGVTVNVDARGSADPAAVRAQVQQGILEAAPAIIAAAESRTISSLRRPRLGGAVQ